VSGEATRQLDVKADIVAIHQAHIGQANKDRGPQAQNRTRLGERDIRHQGLFGIGLEPAGMHVGMGPIGEDGRHEAVEPLP
jgi:hypothetical protein